MFRINIPIPPPNESNALLARSAAAATHTFNHPDADPQSERTHPAGYLATALMHLSDQLVDDSAGFANEALPATTLDCVDEFNKAKNQRCPHCHSPYIESRAWHEPCPTCGQPAHSAEPRTTTLSLTTHLTPPKHTHSIANRNQAEQAANALNAFMVEQSNGHMSPDIQSLLRHDQEVLTIIVASAFKGIIHLTRSHDLSPAVVMAAAIARYAQDINNETQELRDTPRMRGCLHCEQIVTDQFRWHEKCQSCRDAHKDVISILRCLTCDNPDECTGHH
ncbi:hypothetical protein [Stackebrandtia nassauensis]|uniref:Uncharacterized protein n=1 Tax=Stackebrandtia nassauensis (strain DSM 44728 / CIP 108903 / NRRL B-16338 / NBRC 102104 / LLR-40K-21) TaxID=446470 RepID=D3PWQ2_STANL|nr:hypothetical protein [Stackebrandtia nassauensis]ADD43274.1 hypothetical protein Snas_3614 [Stackebrandtia nassauensis DSM 44728]